jgi:hypothetical protein
MLRHVAIFLTALSVFVGVFLFVERTSSPFFQACVNEASGDRSDQTAKVGSAGIGPIVTTYVRCSGRFMDGHGVGLTAIASFIIAAFTATLWIATRQQADLTRQEFISTHRPKVIVRFIQGPFVETGPQFIWVTVCNVGVNKATIVEWGCDFVRRDAETKLWLPPFDASPKPISPVVTLISGQRHVFIVSAKKDYGEAQIAVDAWDAEELCALGIIRYADENSIVRETGFFRVYDPKSKAFIPSQNSEEEYQD